MTNEQYERVAALPFNHSTFYQMKGAILALLALLDGCEPNAGNITTEEKQELLDLIDEITED